jgi:hypothetical protein
VAGSSLAEGVVLEVDPRIAVAKVTVGRAIEVAAEVKLIAVARKARVTANYSRANSLYADDEAAIDIVRIIASASESQ